MPVAPPCRADASRFALGAVCASLLFLAGAASAQTTTFEARVIASLDDVEQFADSSIYVNSSDLELIHDTSDQTVGIRWTGLTIPPGATITTAWIQFAAKETWPDVTSLNFYGQAADAAPQFTTARYNVGSRPRTSAFVNWVPVVWTAGEVTANERTPDLKSVVQEIVSRPGWASGNPLVVIINGTGHRTAWAWDGNAALAPLLHIEYTTGAPPVDQPPVGNLAVSQAASPPLTVNASAAGSTDTDATPIASYSFDWGDGSQATVVNAPTQTATHTYGSTGTYTVTLVATDTGNLASTPVTKSITVTAADAPPVASLAVTQAASPPLTVNASAAGSTDTDATPIASYSFSWGDGSQATVVNAPTQTATHTYASAGTYTVTLVATDTGNLSSTPVTKSVTVNPAAAPVTLEKRVAASTDDAEQFADLSMYLTSSDLELIHDSSDQIVGIRWTGITIPPGATITTAWIQFAAKETWPDVTNLNFYGQSADAAPTFSANTNDVGGRPRTTAFVNWVPVVWNAGEVTASERTPDLKSVVQEVVNRAGWASGNPLVVIISGTGHRTAWAWDGNAAQAPLLHVEYTTGPPPPDQPPVASLAVTQAASPPLTVNASAAGSTDTDATPIASYSFDWGDGSQPTVVNAPTQTATHTYGSTGTYTVTLVATDTGNLASTPVTKSITLTSDQPPLAQLAVTQASSPPLTVSASAAGSTDGDATPIASYSFNWGDGSQPTVVSAPAQTATHTYGSAGTYTVTLVATDTGNLASAPVTQSITVSSSSGGGSVVVYVGYYDTHHAGYPQPKPSPWQGSAGVVFVGKDDDGKGNWDSAALRVDNPTGSSISVTVTCDIGSNHYALWGARTIPAGGRLIMAQTAFQNFDGSDTSPAGCYGCNPNLCLTKVVNTVGVVHVTIGSTTTNYYDNTQVLNTRGVDGAGCPYTNSRNDESQQWKQIGTTPSQAALTGGSDSGWMPAGSEEKALALTPPVPNPARGMLLLRFGMARGGPMQLAVYDLGGRRVRTCLDTELDAGVYEKSVDLTGMRPGMYYAELRTTYGSIHRSFVVTL